MCGIVGFTGKGDAKEIVISGLKKLEYRGYDSAGMSLFNVYDSRFDVFKETGRVNRLVKNTLNTRLSHCGIGHTRWATHGKVTRENAHPHVSSSGRFIIVHNGVIENSEELYKQYLPDYDLKSETDTEIVAHLIEIFSKQLAVDNAIVTTLKLLKGSYALLIVDNENPETIYAAKNRSPLLIGTSSDGTTIASDVLALDGYSKNYVPMRDNTFAICNPSKVSFFNFELDRLKIEYYEVGNNFEDAELGVFDHYMLKEIYEQPRIIKRLIENYIDNGEIKIDEKIINDINESDRIYVLAAGTSMHASLIGKRILENLSNKFVEVHIASEFAYEKPKLSKKPYFIMITQSGETADLRACLKSIEQLNRPTLTITNVITSTLAREATYFLDVMAGPEIAVASTKAYSAQICLLFLLASKLSQSKIDTKDELIRLSQSISDFIQSTDMRKISSEYLYKRNCFLIGRGIAYDLAQEAALKIKEVTYIQTEGFASGELKHGTIALIEEDTPVFAFIIEKNMDNLTRSNLKEVEARGAQTQIFTLKSLKRSGDIAVNDVHSLLAPVALVISAQLLSYYAALERGFDIDKPRNLAKSVTVE
jgi:glucosamine--fructose-6-phosphate aminotransferase (isomerizing)